MKTVSIIVPVYNGAQFIEPCIKYLVDQNYSSMEVCFVVDYKTTDNTIDMLNENLHKLPNGKVVIQHDDGRLGSARNIGVNSTSGDCIWFLDVDDRPFPDFLKKMTTIMEESGSDIVFCNFYSSDSRDLPDTSKMSFSVRTMGRVDALKERCNERLPVTAWSKIYTRDIIVSNGLRYKDGLAEDVDYTYRSLSFANKVSYTSEPLYLYYQNRGSICNSNQNNIRGLAEVDVYNGLLDYIRSAVPEFYDYFVNKAVMTAMRSMVHMDYKTFRDQYDKNWIKGLILDLKKTSPLIEIAIFKTSPYLYYHIARFFMNNFYYRNNTCYDMSVSNKKFQKKISKIMKSV